jgi:triosephosphate isomerase
MRYFREEPMVSTEPFRLRAPLFELGMKGYLYGPPLVKLAKFADGLCLEQKVTLIFTVQYVDIVPVAQAVENLLVFSPHLDPVTIGKGSGSVLPEAVKAAGAHGALLNHAEKPVTLSHIARTIQRAREVDLLTLVCADSPEEAAAIAHLGPDGILAEPPDLIGGTKSVAEGKGDFIARTVEIVRRINPKILVINSAGIRKPEDAAAVIRAGADGTGSTSGVLTAPDPAKMLAGMVQAVSQAWREKHPNP